MSVSADRMFLQLQDGTMLAMRAVNGVIQVSSNGTDWTDLAGGGGGITSVVAGAGLSVDNADPDNPIVAAIDANTWLLARRTEMLALVPQLTTFEYIKVGQTGGGTASVSPAVDGGVEGGGWGTAGTSWLRFTSTVFQTPKTGKWAIAFEAKFPAITVGSVGYFGLVNAGSTHLVGMGTVQSTSATKFVLQITGAGTTNAVGTLDADTALHDCVLAFDTTTLTLRVDGVNIATQTTLTNLTDEGLSIASLASAAVTPGVVVKRIAYGVV